MDLSERIDRDLANGNHWLARQRIESYLATKGYDADLLARAGRIAHDMHDDYNAGRLWLMSNATGPEVDRAIDVFMQYVGKNLQQAAWQLPRAARLVAKHDLPARVRQRLERLELEDPVAKARAGSGIDYPPSTWGTHVLTAIWLALGLFAGLCLVVGFSTIIGWLTG